MVRKAYFISLNVMALESFKLSVCCEGVLVRRASGWWLQAHG
jgi:hypothetical protein